MPTDTFPITANANDGYARRLGPTWASISSATFADEPFGSSILAFSKATDTVNFSVTDVFLRFVTSAIPAGATRDAANLLLYVDDKNNPDGISIAADYYDFGGSASTSADWEQSSSGDCISAFTVASLTIGVVNTIALTTLSGIMRSGETNAQGGSGVTGIRLAPSNTTAPVGNNYVDFMSFEGASQEPRLEVTYTEAAGPEKQSFYSFRRRSVSR